MDIELRKRLLKEWGDALGVDPELQRKIETVAIDEDLLTPQERAEQLLGIMEGRLSTDNRLQVGTQQQSIRIYREHTHEEMLEIAHRAIEELAKDGVKFLPIDPVDMVHCEMLHDEHGREFRYVKMFDIESGINIGGIDIRYAKEGESAG